MNVLGVIIARAGSLGLKNKHILPLLGRPIIEYTFDHAEASRCLTRVVVSSDCPQVLLLSRRRGLETVRRPPHLATPEASVQDSVLHAMKSVEESDALFRADVVVTLYGNVAVRGRDVIDRSVRHLLDTGCDSVRTFCPVGKWHPWWMSRLEGDRVIPMQPGSIHRRQDLPTLYLHDGGVVAASRASMLRAESNPKDPHAFFGIDRRGIRVEPGENIEIDQLRDLFWAEAVLREQRGDQVKVAS